MAYWRHKIILLYRQTSAGIEGGRDHDEETKLSYYFSAEKTFFEGVRYCLRYDDSTTIEWNKCSYILRCYDIRGDRRQNQCCISRCHTGHCPSYRVPHISSQGDRQGPWLLLLRKLHRYIITGLVVVLR